jgi:hypothetical protein
MEYVQGIHSTIGDVFLTLPLLLIAFLLFMGTVTSNVGMLYLFLGHLFFAPALGFLANEKGTAWFENDKFKIAKLCKWLFSVLVTLGLMARSLGGGANYAIYFLALIPFLGQYIAYHYTSEKSVLWFFNPLGWFVHEGDVSASRGSTCEMIPREDSTPWTTPSAWVTHMSFFFGFLFANANAILNEPTPKLNDSSPEAAERQAKLDGRVANRKTLVSIIIAVAVVAALLLLLFRYTKTPCEASFWHSLIPIVLIGLGGASWFQIIYKDCGVRPADVLGMVSSMISPNKADNPIVCVGA